MNWRLLMKLSRCLKRYFQAQSTCRSEVADPSQRALIFETGMNRESCSDELNTAEFSFRNYPQLKPENYHRIKNNLAVTLSLVGFQLDETLNVLYKHKFEKLYFRCHGAAARRNRKKGRIVL